MSVSNGQQANSSTFNNAFVSRTTDSDTTGKIDLQNADGASGGSITNVQRELNKLNSFLGSVANTAYNALPTWTNNDVGASTDDVKLRADLLTAKFNGASGHGHTGAGGDGPQISAGDLADYNDFWSEWQTTTLTGAAGLNDDVSTEFSGETPGGGASTVGVPTTVPYNRVELRTEPGGDQIEEPGGRKVYGRVTESSGTWTLTYYYEDSSGVETAYSLPAQDIRIYYREVFDSSTRPTFGTDEGFIGSLDATADVVDASETQRGVVSINDQTFAGVKTFASATAHERADVASGGTVTALSSAQGFVKLTGASTTELQGIAAGSDGKELLIYNASSGALTLKHENAGASAADRIITSDGNDLVVAQYNAVELIYDTGASRWLAISTTGTGGGGATEPEVELRTITGGEATAKQITLAATPATPAKVLVDFIGVGPQFYGDDYTVSGTTLDWTGLGMDSITVVAGDKLRIVYWT